MCILYHIVVWSRQKSKTIFLYPVLGQVYTRLIVLFVGHTKRTTKCTFCPVYTHYIFPSAFYLSSNPDSWVVWSLFSESFLEEFFYYGGNTADLFLFFNYNDTTTEKKRDEEGKDKMVNAVASKKKSVFPRLVTERTEERTWWLAQLFVNGHLSLLSVARVGNTIHTETRYLHEKSNYVSWKTHSNSQITCNRTQPQGLWVHNHNIQTSIEPNNSWNLHFFLLF